MSHQRSVLIKFNNVEEMQAVRGVLKEFGYPIFHGFAGATEMQGYDCAFIESDGSSVARSKSTQNRTPLITLAQFIERQGTPPKTPAQLELEKLEASAEELNKRIAALKQTI